MISREFVLALSLVVTWVGILSALGVFVCTRNRKCREINSDASVAVQQNKVAQISDPSTQATNMKQNSVAPTFEQSDPSTRAKNTARRTNETLSGGINDLPIDETSFDATLRAELWTEQHAVRLRRQRRTGRSAQQQAFAAESEELFTKLNYSLECHRSDLIRSTLSSIHSMLNDVFSAFHGDKAGEITAMTLVCNVIIEADGLNALSKCKTVCPAAQLDAQWIIEKVVPCIWSS